jgi:hypothetical protein
MLSIVLVGRCFSTMVISWVDGTISFVVGSMGGTHQPMEKGTSMKSHGKHALIG